MSYLNIPESKLAPALAVIIGKLQSELRSKILETVNIVIKDVRSKGCPDPESLKRVQNKIAQITQLTQSISNKLSTFSRIPTALQAPIKGLSAAITIIKSLPIPQAVPPGFGLPIAITTRYADLLHLLKELVAQTKEIIQGIDTSLKTPVAYIDSINPILNRINVVLQMCALKGAIESELNNPLNNRDTLLQVLKDSSIYNDADEFILAVEAAALLEFDYIENSNISSGTVAIINTPQGDIRVLTNKTQGIPNATFLSPSTIESEILNKLELTNFQLAGSNLPVTTKANISTSLKPIISILNQLNIVKTSNISMLNQLSIGKTSNNTDKASILYKAPNGITYLLQIVTESAGSYLAPKRYAIAKDLSGVVVMMGAHSFSSSTDILLEEIKFRIDHQLP